MTALQPPKLQGFIFKGFIMNKIDTLIVDKDFTHIDGYNLTLFQGEQGNKILTLQKPNDPSFIDLVEIARSNFTLQDPEHLETVKEFIRKNKKGR